MKVEVTVDIKTKIPFIYDKLKDVVANLKMLKYLFLVNFGYSMDCAVWHWKRFVGEEQGGEKEDPGDGGGLESLLDFFVIPVPATTILAANGGSGDVVAYYDFLRTKVRENANELATINSQELKKYKEAIEDEKLIAGYSNDDFPSVTSVIRNGATNQSNKNPSTQQINK